MPMRLVLNQSKQRWISYNDSALFFIGKAIKTGVERWILQGGNDDKSHFHKETENNVHMLGWKSLADQNKGTCLFGGSTLAEFCLVKSNADLSRMTDKTGTGQTDKTGINRWFVIDWWRYFSPVVVPLLSEGDLHTVFHLIVKYWTIVFFLIKQS